MNYVYIESSDPDFLRSEPKLDPPLYSFDNTMFGGYLEKNRIHLKFSVCSANKLAIARSYLIAKYEFLKKKHSIAFSDNLKYYEH